MAGVILFIRLPLLFLREGAGDQLKVTVFELTLNPSPRFERDLRLEKRGTYMIFFLICDK
jgi:hypothetical protein